MIGLSINLFSQELNGELIIGFLNQTLKDYFSHKILPDKTARFYIKKDSLQLKTQTEFENFEIQFVNDNQAQELIKRRKISELYWTKINKVSKDTVDILIGGWTVNYKRGFLKKGKFEYAAWCGGTDGYLPQGRFVYNHKTGNWDYITEKEIIDFNINKYQNKISE